MKPLISVLVPAFNSERFLGRCLRSLLAQSFKEQFEIVVVDDGSSDRTAYALTQFGSSVVTIRNSSNRGLPASLNTALKNSKGKYIVRVDSDDYVNQYFLAFLWECLRTNENYDAIACDYYQVSDNERVVSRCSAKEEPIGCGILFKKDHVLQLGGYDEEFLRHEEKEFMQRFEKHFKLGHLEIPLYRYRRHNANITLDTELMGHFEKKLRNLN